MHVIFSGQACNVLDPHAPRFVESAPTSASVNSQAEICLLRYLQIVMSTRGLRRLCDLNYWGGHARLAFRGGECPQVENAFNFSATNVGPGVSLSVKLLSKSTGDLPEALEKTRFVSYGC